VITRAEIAKTEVARPEPIRPEPPRAALPPQPAGHGTGNGVLGVLPASGAAPAPSQAMAYADPQKTQPQAVQQNGAIKPVASAPTSPAATRSGWMIQVGALETESEARSRIDAARNQAKGLLNKADPFTEPVVAKDNRKLFRARFAGLERDQAEAVCRTLKRADISCITVRN
jgi:D-alanyl-D-alanine carboxypeptidase